MNILEKLKQLGLTESESKVYFYLINHGISTPPQIAQNTNITRTNCYNILSKLKDKGLVKEQKLSNKKSFIATEPENLLHMIDRKKIIVKELLPDLKAIYIQQKNKPKIRFYDGWDEIKNIYLESLQSEEIIAIGSLTKFEAIDKSFFRKYSQKIKQRKIIFHDIVTKSSEKYSQIFKEHIKNLYTYKKIPVDDDKMPTDILIWDDKIALITFSEPIFGTILINKDLAQTFKTLFRTLEKLL